jgi:hypothetical protein
VTGEGSGSDDSKGDEGMKEIPMRKWLMMNMRIARKGNETNSIVSFILYQVNI